MLIYYLYERDHNLWGNCDMEQEIKLLVEGAIVGNEDDFTKLLQHYMKDILCFASMCLSTQDAEDVAQEVALKIYKKIHQLRDPDHFVHWMSAIVHNVTVNYVKKAYRIKNVNIDTCDQELLKKNWPDIANVEFLPEDYMEILELRQTVVEEIRELPEIQKICLTYHFLYDFKRAEIAKATGLTARQVSTGLNYGKKKLKHRLEQRLGTQFTFAVIPVGIFPILSQLLQVEQAVTISPAWSVQVTDACIQQIKPEILLLSKKYRSKLGHGKLIAGATVSAAALTVVTVMTLSSGPVIPKEEVASTSSTQTMVISSIEQPEPEKRPIETVADMIGEDEASILDNFVKGPVSENDWQAFLGRIDAKQDESANEPAYEYNVYILEKQDKRLLLAEKKPMEGGIMQTFYCFDQSDYEPMKITQIILQFNSM